MIEVTTREKIFIDFIKENQNYFYRIAFFHVKDEDVAMDIVQEAIVKAFQKRYTLRKIDFMKTWFYRILLNECNLYFRKNKKILFIPDYEFYENKLSIKDQTDQNDLYDAIDGLNPKLKTIVILYFFEGMKLEEISKITHTNLSTVKSRLYKALDILKIKMEAI